MIKYSVAWIVFTKTEKFYKSCCYVNFAGESGGIYVKTFSKGCRPYPMPMRWFHVPSHAYAMVSCTIPCLWDGSRELCKLSNRLKVFVLKNFLDLKLLIGLRQNFFDHGTVVF